MIVGALGKQDGFDGVTGDGPFATIEFMAKTAIRSPVSLFIEDYEVYNYSEVGSPGPVLDGNVFVFEGEVR